jgi:hypothetical protein
MSDIKYHPLVSLINSIQLDVNEITTTIFVVSSFYLLVILLLYANDGGQNE